VGGKVPQLLKRFQGAEEKLFTGLGWIRILKNWDLGLADAGPAASGSINKTWVTVFHF